MRVIFLDVDGVLNSWVRGRAGCISKGKLRLLKELVDLSGAEIVVSSSWRLNSWGRRRLERYLGYRGMRVLDYTPDLGDEYTRGNEIMMWLDTMQDNVEQYVILDDTCGDDHDGNEIFEEHTYNLIEVDGDEGLTPEDIQGALTIIMSDDI